MNTPEQFTEHVHVQFSSCSFHLFLAVHDTPPYVHVQFMFSSHLRPEAIFLRYPEGQTTNVLFLEILTRATPHASCIHLSRARTSALHPSQSISLSRALSSIRSDHAHMHIDSDKYCIRVTRSPPVAQLHVSISHARGPPRCSAPELPRAIPVLLPWSTA